MSQNPYEIVNEAQHEALNEWVAGMKKAVDIMKEATAAGTYMFHEAIITINEEMIAAREEAIATWRDLTNWADTAATPVVDVNNGVDPDNLGPADMIGAPDANPEVAPELPAGMAEAARASMPLDEFYQAQDDALMEATAAVVPTSSSGTTAEVVVDPTSSPSVVSVETDTAAPTAAIPSTTPSVEATPEEVQNAVDANANRAIAAGTPDPLPAVSAASVTAGTTTDAPPATPSSSTSTDVTSSVVAPSSPTSTEAGSPAADPTTAPVSIQTASGTAILAAASDSLASVPVPSTDATVTAPVDPSPAPDTVSSTPSSSDAAASSSVLPDAPTAPAAPTADEKAAAVFASYEEFLAAWAASDANYTLLSSANLAFYARMVNEPRVELTTDPTPPSGAVSEPPSSTGPLPTSEATLASSTSTETPTTSASAAPTDAPAPTDTSVAAGDGAVDATKSAEAAPVVPDANAGNDHGAFARTDVATGVGDAAPDAPRESQSITPADVGAMPKDLL